MTATLAIDATVPEAQEATNAGIVLNFVNCGLGVGDDGANEETYNQFLLLLQRYDRRNGSGSVASKSQSKRNSTDSGVLGMNTNVENEALNHRVDSFRSYMEKNAPGLELTDTYYNGNVVETAQSNAENIISHTATS